MTVKKNGKPTIKDYNALLERVEKAEKVNKDNESKMAGILSSQKAPEVHVAKRVGSLEEKALTYFGCKDARGLMNVNTGAAEFSWVPEEAKKMVLALKNDMMTARIIAQLFYEDGNCWDRVGASEKTDRFATVKTITQTKYFEHVLGPKLKAFGTDVVGGGAEWVPTAIASSYISEFELQRQLISALVQVPMPTSPYELPTNTNSVARRGTENTSATQGSFGTDVLEFKAKKFLEYFIFSEEINEDSAPGIVALGRQQLIEAHERAFETASVNGVEAPGAHIDSDTQAGAADLAEKQWNGYRKLALDNAANGATIDFGNANVTDANLRLMRQRLGKLGVDPTQLMWLPGSVSYLQMLATDNVVTVDKMGPQATVLKGMLGAYDGIPIMQTGYMREDLNDAGVHDGLTTDRTGILLVHRKRWYFATRRPIRLAIRPSKSEDDRIEMASYSRTDFVGHPQSTRDVELSVSYGLNIAI